MSEIRKIFDDSTIEGLRKNKQEITEELLDKLRSEGNDGKQIALDILDLEKDSEQYYIDAYANRISFNGNRRLKKSYTLLHLTDIHKKEIAKCAASIGYFKKNYVKIVTPNGITFPDFRKYQDDFIDLITQHDNESIVSLQPRQCCSSSTVVKIQRNSKEQEQTLDDLFNDCKKLYNIARISTNSKFIESYSANGRMVLTQNGYKEVIQVHKTIPFRKFVMTLDNGIILKCAHNHVVISENFTELYAKDSLNHTIQTDLGFSKVISVYDTGIEENMYDISINSKDELYYTNGVLSHNSGKTVTLGIYLAHVATFKQDMNIGIAANKNKQAAEFLDKTKKILIELPIWLQAGVNSWNKTYIENENGMRIITDSTSADSFRGFSCLEKNTPIEVFDKYDKKFKTITIGEMYNMCDINNT
jgi:hypothetical protein